MLLLFSVIPNTITADSLKLKSSYIFNYYFLKIYEVKLYLPEKNSNIKALSNVSKKLEFTYYRNISAKTLIEKANESLFNNPAFEFDKFKNELAMLNMAYLDVKKGDKYVLQYTPNVGTELLLNEKRLALVQGYEFSKYYFGIWLSEYSFSDELYRSLVYTK